MFALYRKQKEQNRKRKLIILKFYFDLFVMIAVLGYLLLVKTSNKKTHFVNNIDKHDSNIILAMGQHPAQISKPSKEYTLQCNSPKTKLLNTNAIVISKIIYS